MSDTVHTFQLGSSTVVTLPKKLGIRPGQELKIEKFEDQIILKPHKKMTKEEIHDLIKSIGGKLEMKYHPTPEEINEELERSYDDVLPRR